MMRKIRDLICRILFPKSCGFCGREIAESEILNVCDTCLGNLPVIRGSGKFVLKGHIDFVLSPFCYVGGVRECIKLMKFKDKPVLAKTLAAFMMERFASQCSASDFDVVIPVPMTWLERVLLGYNPAELLAHEIARRCALPCDTESLVKIRHTRRQSNLCSYEKRMRNVRDAFSCKKDLDDLRILLVDDVYTTGATVKNCAKALKVAGAGRICVLTAANASARGQKKKVVFQRVLDMVFRRKDG